MRIATAIIIFFVMIHSASALDVESKGVTISIPDDSTLHRQFDSQLFQYQGKNEEQWSIQVFNFTITHPEDQKEIDKIPDKKELELKEIAEKYTKFGVIHHFERKILNDKTIMLIFGYQMLRSGYGLPENGQLYSTLEFYVFGKNGSRVDVKVDWPGELNQKLDSYIKRLASIKMASQPAPSFKRKPKGGAD